MLRTLKAFDLKNKKVFIKYLENREPLTYEQFLLEIKTTARYLQDLGLKCEDRLVVQIRKSHRNLSKIRKSKFCRKFQILKMTQKSVSAYPKIPKSDFSKFIEFGRKP